MKLRLFLIVFLICPLMAGKKRFVPPIHVQIEGIQNLAAPMEVALFTRRSFGFKYTEVEKITLDARGHGSFEARALKKFDWLALNFSWQPKGLPVRNIVYEIKAKKGSKVSGGHAINAGSDKAAYILDGIQKGDCDNLLSYKEETESINILFQVPATYLECQDAGGEVNNVTQIGSRDLNKGKLNYYKFDDDKRMGQQFASELSSGEDNPPLNDALVRDYIEDLVKRIGAASDMPDLNIQAQVINADVLNAFAVPGGYIWVYRGLIENTETEAELAGVIAHEIAHVTSRHGTEGMTSAINKTTIASLAGEVISESTDKAWLREMIQTAVGAGTQFWVVGGTRKSEAEADKLGAQYAYRAGYDPMGIASLFARWAEKKGDSGSRLDKYFSDHPSDEDRVRAVTNDVGYFLPPKAGLITSSKRYKDVKARLKQLPRPTKGGEVAANALFSSFSRINAQMITAEVESYLISKKPVTPEQGEMP